jgi:membrane protease subunit HflC
MSKNIVIIYASIISFLAVIFIANPFYVVDQRKQALVFQFGEVVKVVKEPGLHLKIPIIQRVAHFDNQILNLEVDKKEVICKGKKRLIVNAFAKYKIRDPLKFYQSMGDIGKVRTRLTPIFESSLREVLGKFPLAALLTSERAEIMTKIQDTLESRCSNDFGINIIDVRIVRADLPNENKNAIFKRMITDREKEAKEHRAEGAEEAARIKSRADKDREILLADAQKQSEEIKGEGDNISAKIFADAYNNDPEFYSFYRSLAAYRVGLNKANTKLILSPTSEFLKYFVDINGKN